MIAFLLRRLGHGVLVLLMVSTVTFAIMVAAPGGPSVLADPKLSIAERAEIETRLGLDQPPLVQYTRWLGRAVRGDFGASFLYQTPSLDSIASRLPQTVLLAGTALVITLAVGIPLGMLAAARRGGALDRLVAATTGVALAVPVFWSGLMLVFIFAVWLRLLPAGGMVTDGVTTTLADRLRHLLLPAIVLASAGTAEIVRYTRSAAITTLALPFVQVARARGLSSSRLLWHHALRHVLASVITVIGLQLPRLVGGAAITETVFSWPGMGRLGVEAALGRDYPLVMAVTLVVSAGVVLASIVADVIQMMIDPRVRVA
ncbi:MAG TPA: ABC transporter permease [Gemmatimonadaceae bacterium]|nr:ABC transporter permease [Gemmatimonadaceae bacterium]